MERPAWGTVRNIYSRIMGPVCAPVHPRRWRWMANACCATALVPRNVRARASFTLATSITTEAAPWSRDRWRYWIRRSMAISRSTPTSPSARGSSKSIRIAWRCFPRSRKSPATSTFRAITSTSRTCPTSGIWRWSVADSSRRIFSLPSILWR